MTREKAEQRLNDIIRNDPDNIADIRYWVGYIDALRAIEDEK